MMFGGQSAVEVNPKINVEELKSFTSMSLYIKLQKDNQQLAASPDRFILYLGSKNVRESPISFKKKKKVEIGLKFICPWFFLSPFLHVSK